MADQAMAAQANGWSDDVRAQLEETRLLLRADAEAAGQDPATVDAALDAAAGRYAAAHVQKFIGILVEREVREQLGLRPADRLA